MQYGCGLMATTHRVSYVYYVHAAVAVYIEHFNTKLNAKKDAIYIFPFVSVFVRMDAAT